MNAWLVLLALVAIALLAVVVPVALVTYRHWRRPWRLNCPHAGTVAQIRVGAARAAVAELFGGKPEIDRCSLWPSRLDCHDECLALPLGTWQRMRRGEAPPRTVVPGARRTIVVSLDGTPAGEGALATVAGLAQHSNTAIRLLRVLPPVTEQRDGDHVIAYADQETTRLEAEARAYLRRLAASLPGAVVEDVIRFGATTTQVVEEAEAVSADLIVVAVPRRRGLARLLGTPTARRFRRVTTIPLLIVPCAAPVAA